MIVRQHRFPQAHVLFVLLALCLIVGISHASLGDRLHDFRDCVEVGTSMPICFGKAQLTMTGVQGGKLQKRELNSTYASAHLCIERTSSLTIFQPSTSDSSSGHALPNATTHVNKSSPTGAWRATHRCSIPSSSSMENGHSTAFSASRNHSPSSSPSSTSSRTSTACGRSATPSRATTRSVPTTF